MAEATQIISGAAWAEAKIEGGMEEPGDWDHMAVGQGRWMTTVNGCGEWKESGTWVGAAP